MFRHPLRPGQETSGIFDAVKVASLDPKRAGEVTYTVIVQKPPRRAGDERNARRRRTRLRAGKVLDRGNTFLIECQIYDRSPRGARLRLLSDVDVPHEIRLYEDERENVVAARVVWRANRQVGIRFEDRRDTEMGPAQLKALRGKYYAAGR